MSRRAVAHAPHHRVQADTLKLGQEGLGADPVVPQEHHRLLAQLVGDVHHLFCQLRHLTPLEGLKIQKFPARHPVLVVVVPLIDDVFRPEGIARFPLELLQNVGGDRGGITVPVHILFPL